MRETEYCRKVIPLGKAGRRTIIYSLLTEPGPETVYSEEYGVAVSIPEIGEREQVRRITVSRSEAERLLDLIATGFVTPVSLRDVVEDWLGGKQDLV